MNDLVFIEPNKIDAMPFTTSKVIAEQAGVAHRHVKKQIESHRHELESFGLLVACATESTGGRPEEITALNEAQATLLITFLKNTPVVVAFKTELVRQFYSMRAELQRRQIYREQLKPIRRELTDVIKEIPNINQWSYKLYTDLAYKAVLGKISKQIRADRGADKKDTAIDYMTAEEITAVAKMQNRITVLLEMGMDYKQIKSLVLERLVIGKIA